MLRHPASTAGLLVSTLSLVMLSACSTYQKEPSPPPAVSEAVAIDAPPTAEATRAGAAASIAEPEVVQLLPAGQRLDAAQDIAPAADAKAASLLKRSEVLASSVQAAAAPVRSLQYAPLAAAERETYAHLEANPVQRAIEQPVSTFSIDVDTGAYSNVRRFLNEGRLPPRDAVRVEELVNYFDYAYAPPPDRSTPFAVHTEIAPTPWNAKTRLLRIGIQGWKPQGELPASNLVFLVDVSGSMDEPAKLPLVKASLKLLARQLRHEDRVSLVVYAGRTAVVLEPTPGDDTGTIDAALDRLDANGSTNGAGGIQLAYEMAAKGFIRNGNNRVLLATDGDFNVGISDFEQLKNLIEDKRRSGIALSTLGFGSGNYNDRLMEQLADAGNGNYAYIDSLREAQKVLVDQRAATLLTIAKDVKIQVEFNPATVSEYRLIGYENRLLKREDFNNDAIDAGEIGAGHRVTALYEIALAGEGGEKVDPLRYGRDKPVRATSDELAFLRLRYKKPDDGNNARSLLIERPIRSSEIEDADETTPAFRLAAAVAAYGQLLRGGTYTGSFGYADVTRLARSARGDDSHGYAGEFLQLAQLAGNLETRQASAAPDRRMMGDD